MGERARAVQSDSFRARRKLRGRSEYGTQSSGNTSSRSSSSSRSQPSNQYQSNQIPSEQNGQQHASLRPLRLVAHRCSRNHAITPPAQTNRLQISLFEPGRCELGPSSPPSLLRLLEINLQKPQNCDSKATTKNTKETKWDTSSFSCVSW
jgi:hypothetical protein